MSIKTKLLSYKYYLIDIDRTLWNFDLNSENAITMLVRKNHILHSAILKAEGEDDEPQAMHRFFEHYDIRNHELWAAYERGELTKDDLRWKRFYCTFLDYGIDNKSISEQFGEDYLNQMILEKELMPGAKAMIENIQASGGIMSVLSNGFKEVQYHKLERSGIRHFFKDVIVSEEVGYHKPSPEIFALALERLCGVNRDDILWEQVKSQTLMIGDDLTNDIIGAKDFGIDQYFYNHKGVTSPKGITYEYPDLEAFIQ